MDSHSLQHALNLLVGFRFNPTDQILLENYLYNKIHSLPYSSLVVFDCDLYGDMEPWQIWNFYKGVDGQDLYFFTKLKRSTNNSGHLSAHINRKIGLAGGTWSGENSATPISDTDVPIIGYCRRLRYENPQLPEHHGEWIMHEYSLHESMIIHGYSDSNYVLCRIRKNERAKRKTEKICNIQPIKKRVLSPNINEMEKNNKRGPTRKANKRQSSSELQLVEPRVVAPNMVYNMPCDPTNQITTNLSYSMLMTTDQDTSNVPYKAEIARNQSTSDMPYVHNMAINQSTNDVPYMLGMSTYQGTSNVPYEADQIANNQSTSGISYVHNMTINQSTSDVHEGTSNVPYEADQKASNQSTSDMPYVHNMTINQSTSDVHEGTSNMPYEADQKASNQSTSDISYVHNMTINQSTSDVPYMLGMTTDQDTSNVPCEVDHIVTNQNTSDDMSYMHNTTIYQSTSGAPCMPEMTINQFTNDVSYLPQMSTDQGTSGVSHDPNMTINQSTCDVQNMTITQSTNGVSNIPEITTNRMEPTANKLQWIDDILDFSDTKYDDLADLSSLDEYWDESGIVGQEINV